MSADAATRAYARAQLEAAEGSPTPAQVAAAEAKLPAAVNAAILAECDSPRICSVNGRVKVGIRCGPCEGKALATILARLTAAETARDALKAEIRDQAMKQLASDAGWELDCDRVRAERDAALARAERAESVLTEACQMQSILLMAGEMTAQERRTARAVANGIAAKVRAALAQPAPAEET